VLCSSPGFYDAEVAGILEKALVQSLDDIVDEDAESAWQQEIANRVAA
jgi:hypothetical protein